MLAKGILLWQGNQTSPVVPWLLMTSCHAIFAVVFIGGKNSGNTQLHVQRTRMIDDNIRPGELKANALGCFERQQYMYHAESCIGDVKE
jgi:hypothetical protein